MIKNPSFEKLTEAQRTCLSHILRNSEQTIEWVLEVVERQNSDLTAKQLADSLNGVSRSIDAIIHYAENGSFCSLECGQCKLLGKYFGCSGEPDRESEELLKLAVG